MGLNSTVWWSDHSSCTSKVQSSIPSKVHPYVDSNLVLMLKKCSPFCPGTPVHRVLFGYYGFLPQLG